MNSKSFIGFALSVFVIAILSMGIGIRFRKTPYSPVEPTAYENTVKIIDDVEQLPVITSIDDLQSQHQWETYISLARRLKKTEPSLIERAFQQLSDRQTNDYYLKTRFKVNVRLMLLMRICFECPAQERMNQIHGSFLFSPENEVNGRAFDMNWPIKTRFGHFYLQDSINGYTGPPYDPKSEFAWRVANCKWRKF